MQRINISKDYISLGTNNTNNRKDNFHSKNYMPDYIAEKLVNEILNDKFD